MRKATSRCRIRHAPFPATPLPNHSLVSLRFLVAASTLLAIGPRAYAASACPDVSGRYTITGFGKTLGDALATMRASQAGFRDSGLELHGVVDGELTVGVKSGRSGGWSKSPLVLRKGTDFECEGGAVVFHPHTDTSRQGDDGNWYAGESTVSLSPQASGELAIDVSFTGSQRITLYSYDSANVSVPRLGTRTTLKDAIRLPPYTDPAPVVATPAAPAAEREVRELLTARVLGNVMMGWVSTEKDGVNVTFNAPTSDDIGPFEERLRNAAIDYRMKAAPIWTNNAYYLVLVIQPRRGESRAANSGN